MYSINKTGDFQIPKINSYQEFASRIKVSKTVIDPYSAEQFKYKNITQEIQKAEKLRGITKKRGHDPEMLKVFDDASLHYDCRRTELLHFKKLDFSNSQITENGIADLGESEFAANIEEIDFSLNVLNVTDVTLKFIAESPNLQNIKTLVLTDTAISDAGIMYLFEPFTMQIEILTTGELYKQNQKTLMAKKMLSPSFASTGVNFRSRAEEFKATNYTNNFYDTFQSQQMMTGGILEKKLPNLSALVLYGNLKVTDKAMKCLAYSRLVDKIKYLDIRSTMVTDQGILYYVQSPNSQHLQYLDISDQEELITSQAIESICQSQYCKNLVILKCKNCHIDDKAAEDLSETQNVEFIEELDLGRYAQMKKKKEKRESNISGLTEITKKVQQYGITDKGARALSRAKYLGRIEFLSLLGQLITDEGAIQLINSDTFKTIKTFNVSNNEKIGNPVEFLNTLTTLNAIIASEKARELQKLYVQSCAVDEDGIERLEKKMPQIQLLHSLQNIKIVQLRTTQFQAGIRVYMCEQCAKVRPPNLCGKCRNREIKGNDFPAKLCQKCGEEYEMKPGNKKKKCFLCKQENKFAFQIFKCYLCSVGMQRHHCINCNQLVDM